MDNKEQLDKIVQTVSSNHLKIKELQESGYAGISSTGSIVDRREFPNAIPMKKNSAFGIPEPIDLNTLQK